MKFLQLPFFRHLLDKQFNMIEVAFAVSIVSLSPKDWSPLLLVLLVAVVAHLLLNIGGGIQALVRSVRSGRSLRG